MSDDHEILNVIAKAFLPRGAGPTTIPTLPIAEAARALVALRAAGYDVAPADTIRLGRAVESTEHRPDRLMPRDGPWLDPSWLHGWSTCLSSIYRSAGVERGGQ